VAIYDFACVGLYDSTSLAQGVFWQRIQIATISPISICIIWFVATIVEQTGNRIIKFLKLWFLLLFVLILIRVPGFTLALSTPAIKNIVWYQSTLVTYYESEIGIGGAVVVLSAIATYIYLFYLLYCHRRKTRSKYLTIVLVSQLVYCAGVVNDSLVASRVYQFVYVSEYAFFIIVMAMAYVLINQFIDLHATIENTNINLEKKVSERTSEIQGLNDKLRHLAELDGLTGTYNRRFFDEYIDIELKRAGNQRDYRRSKTSPVGLEMNFGLAMIDIDDFKHINDTYGHTAGDHVLQELVEVIREHMFTRDILCRYGGEEFAVILTKTDREGILPAIEKIRQGVDEHSFCFDPELPLQHVTISIGAASFDEVLSKNPLAIIKLADTRLYDAKTTGKNRVVCCGG
jgi:diguanylate cyclase (GGDEF)-like protein